MIVTEGEGYTLISKLTLTRFIFISFLWQKHDMKKHLQSETKEGLLVPPKRLSSLIEMYYSQCEKTVINT